MHNTCPINSCSFVILPMRAFSSSFFKQHHFTLAIFWFLRSIAFAFQTLFFSFCDPMNYSLPGSFVHGISQARILEWVSISFPRDLPDPWIGTGRFFTTEPPGKPHLSSILLELLKGRVSSRKMFPFDMRFAWICQSGWPTFWPIS